MSRPKKGEGEHRNKLTTKGPLIFTAALLFCYPICIAEAVSAQTTSSFEKTQPQAYVGSQLRLLDPQLSKLATLRGIQPKNYPSLSSLASETPSVSDINNLKSSIQRLETQLDTLLLTSKNPNAPQVQKAIQVLTDDIKTAKSRLATAEKAVNDAISAQATLQAAVKRYEAAQARVEAAQKAQEEAKQAYDAKVSQLSTSSSQVESARTAYTQAQTNLQTAQQTFNEADAALTQQLSAKTQAYSSLLTRQEEANTAASNLQAAQQTFNEAQQELNAAQYNYDTNLIPDPDWTAPTYQKENIRTVENTRTVEVKTLVPNTTTTLQEQVIPNLLFNSDFSRGTEGWSGVNPGWQGSNPALIDGEIIFSYQNQTVSQGLFSGPFQNATLTLSADWFNNDSNTGRVDNYSMTVEAKDINQNTVGSATYTSTGAHDWDRKSVSLTATGPVSYVTVSFSGIDNGFWYGIYGPHFKNPTLQISHGQMVTETTYEEVITYEQETYYTYETYYTTELVTVEGTIDVKINEGGQATFNAPAGAVFVSSNLRYEAIARPTCGKDIAPQLTGLSTITIQALNSVWGDPCGGWQKHITGTLTYLGQPTAPLIKNPELLVILNEKQAIFNTAQSNFSSASAADTTAQSSLSTAQSTYDQINTSYLSATTAKETAASDLQAATTSNEAAVETKTAAETTYEQIASEHTAAEEVLTTTSNEVTTQAASLSQEETAKTEAETTVVETSTEAKTSFTAAKTSQESITFTEVETTIQETNKEAPAETGSEDLPAEINSETLLATDLSQVDPTEMTPEQAEQLVEAALVIFETAEEGSEEYEQALDALYLAAEQDDIELSPELAAIPGLAAATELINFFGNAGSDMSPKKREESQKIVVTAVVAAGAAIQSAAAAAATASGGTNRR